VEGNERGGGGTGNRASNGAPIMTGTAHCALFMKNILLGQNKIKIMK